MFKIVITADVESSSVAMQKAIAAFGDTADIVVRPDSDVVKELKVLMAAMYDNNSTTAVAVIQQAINYIEELEMNNGS